MIPAGGAGALHVEERGKGEVVVLLHGTPTTPEHLRPLAERLAARWRTLLVHLPGYGSSERLTPYALERSHELVEEALAARAITHAHLLGHSGGSTRAFALATRGKVTALSVVGLGAIAWYPEDTRQRLRDLARMLRGGLDLRPLMPVLMLSPNGRKNPQWVAEVTSWGAACDAQDLAAEFDALTAAEDPRSAIAALDVPVLLRVGALDTATPPACSEDVAAVARHAALQVVPDVGHAILNEDFEGTAAAVESHLEAATVR